MNFGRVEKKYRPIPFWSWNSKLESNETLRQIDLMDKCGMGGFFMHARGGLDTEYMSDEWFEQIRISSEDARARGMYPWAYDENGWPSGFGDGKVNGIGDFYRQKTLQVEPLWGDRASEPNTLLVKSGCRYFYTVNPFYVDISDKDVVAKFIEVVYEEYDKRVGDVIEGFFTDEPQLLRDNGYPWSFSLEEEFKNTYGYSLIEKLDELFFDIGDYERTRVDYWHLMTKRLSENYFKQIYDWCENRGYKFTGHLTNEEGMLYQLLASGTSMAHYEYFTIPGIDWLSDRIEECLTPAAVGSAAAQLGKRQVLTESYGAAGHQLSHAEMKRIYEWQMVRGVNLLCTHLEGYTLEGIRKRDFPPAMYYQQPWWEDMDVFVDTVSRIGKILTEGRICADTLIIHPQTTAWRLYNGALDGSLSSIRKINSINDLFLKDIRALEDKHILCHFGDELIMERHGRVAGRDLIIGEMRYSKVIIPEYATLLPTTRALIDEYIMAGGEIVTVDSITPNPITEENRLTYTKREYEDFDVHYFVNTDNARLTATFARGNYLMEQTTGKLIPFFGSYNFEPYESIVIIDTHDDRERRTESDDSARLDISGSWQLDGATYNSITLDTCDYSIDGGEVISGGYVLDILPRMNELRRPAKLWQRYTFITEAIPKEFYLCIENPSMFKININGVEVENNDKGYFIDKSFRLVDISNRAKLGENVIELECVVSQSDKTYKHLSESWEFETMKNSLSYDMEIEPIYIVGDFGVRLTDTYETDKYSVYVSCGDAIITDAPRSVDITALDASGYPEFAGTLELSRTFTLDEGETDRYVYLDGEGINSVHITVNGEHVAAKMFPPFKTDISDYLRAGENTVELKILNNLRNMQGPHHKIDTGWGVCPASFYREQNVFHHVEGATESCHEPLGEFVKGHSLIHFGMKC